MELDESGNQEHSKNSVYFPVYAQISVRIYFA